MISRMKFHYNSYGPNYHKKYFISLLLLLNCFIYLGLRRRRESAEGKYVTDPTQLQLKFQRPRSRTSSRYIRTFLLYIAF